MQEKEKTERNRRTREWWKILVADLVICLSTSSRVRAKLLRRTSLQRKGPWEFIGKMKDEKEKP